MNDTIKIDCTVSCKLCDNALTFTLAELSNESMREGIRERGWLALGKPSATGLTLICDKCTREISNWWFKTSKIRLMEQIGFPPFLIQNEMEE